MELSGYLKCKSCAHVHAVIGEFPSAKQGDVLQCSKCRRYGLVADDASGVHKGCTMPVLELTADYLASLPDEVPAVTVVWSETFLCSNGEQVDAIEDGLGYIYIKEVFSNRNLLYCFSREEAKSKAMEYVKEHSVG